MWFLMNVQTFFSNWNRVLLLLQVSSRLILLLLLLVASLLFLRGSRPLLGDSPRLLRDSFPRRSRDLLVRLHRDSPRLLLSHLEEEDLEVSVAGRHCHLPRSCSTSSRREDLLPKLVKDLVFRHSMAPLSSSSQWLDLSLSLLPDLLFHHRVDLLPRRLRTSRPPRLLWCGSSPLL